MAEEIVTGGTHPLHLRAVHEIEVGDIGEALRLGWRDFMTKPSAILYLVIIYPMIGVVATYIAWHLELVGLIYPMAAGFALIGPIASVGVLELSRRIEAGEDVSLLDAFSIRERPAFRGILLMALLLFTLFVLWIVAAERILVATLGDLAPDEFGAFLAAAFTSWPGLAMFVFGNLVGFVFAVAALCVSVISLPMLVDGERSVTVAIATSVQAVMVNPVPMAAWGLTVAIGLALGMIPIFAGLLITLPVLGHANWHLYRRVLPPEG